MKILLLVFVCTFLCWLHVDAQQRIGREYRRKGKLRHGGGTHNITHDGDDELEDDVSPDVHNVLHKINDKVTEISLVTNQFLRRLDNLEYKITKMEVQIQEKTESLRIETKEIGRRAQQLDWQSSKTEQTLDALRADTNFLKQALEHLRTMPSITHTPTPAILLYCIAGLLSYAVIPLTNIDECETYRQSDISKQSDPCGLIVRSWWIINVSEFPLFHIAYGLQLYVCLMTSVSVLAITMLLVGLLMYIVALLQHCRQEIKKCFQRDVTIEKFNYCIIYHIRILKYSSKVTEAFSSMMLMHITLTSFQISVLGFEVLMVTTRTDSIRFGMHLVGWIILLFLVCNYGQEMIDESLGIGLEVYSTNWYDSTDRVGRNVKMMIMRSQRPLTLSAASLGIMSFETFLRVMSTAYSYFTLLLKVKNND